MATHRAYNNTLLLHSEPNFDKPLHQCAERRHFTRLQPLFRMKTAIVMPRVNHSAREIFCRWRIMLLLDSLRIS
jgi:hypothetical protein